MRIRLRNRLVKALLVAASVAVLPATVFAAGSGQSLADQINVIENRFFFRMYTRDPVEKRLERLELLVFGATQAGTNEERLARLKKTIADRDTTSSGRAKGKGPAEEGQAQSEERIGAGAKPYSTQTRPGASSSQYPILNTLEWRALKKTYPAETLDQRLERMETRLFGSSSPAMAYADRVERLKRTLGVGMAQNLPDAPEGPFGPMPKARPRRPDIFGGMPQPGGSEPFGGFSYPQMGVMPGIPEVFKDLQRQMEQLQKMPTGVWEWDSESGSWIDKNNGRRLKPGQGQSPLDINPSPSNPFPFNPRRFKAPTTPVIPPYDDPNSI